MRKKLLVIVLTLLFAIGVIGAVSQLAGYRKSDLAYENAKALLSAAEQETAPEITASSETEAPAETEAAAAPETEAAVSAKTTAAPKKTEPVTDDQMAALLKADLAALKKVNPDVIGWIRIPDTSIDYPLLKGEDNTHYLDYAWDGSKNAGGSIYMDYRSDSSLSDFHTIIYGHRMYRDAMFNALRKYADEDFLKDHPSVYILTEAGVARYDAFAAYDADVKGSSYRLGLTDAKGQQALFNYCRNHSVIDSDIIPIAKDGDRLLTLSTCSADGGEKTRWVVHFVLGEFTAQ